MRLTFVVPWPDDPNGWIVPHLPTGFKGTVVSVAPSADAAPTVRRLPPYLRETAALLARRDELRNCNVLFAWEMRAIVAVALARRHGWELARLPFVAVGPIIKNALRTVGLPLVRFALAGADRILCFSRHEAQTYPNLLRLPAARFVFVPSPWDCSNLNISTREDDYVLALGHSGRDYPTLVRALANLKIPAIIVARSWKDLFKPLHAPIPAYQPSPFLPPNITVRCNTNSHTTDELIANATVNVLPLRETGVSAGQSVLLRTLAQGKAIIVSDVTGIRDYILSNETAVLVPHGKEWLLREAIKRLWNDKPERNRIGQNAATIVRQEFDFPVFAARVAVIARELAYRERDSSDF